MADKADMRVRHLIGVPFVRGGRDPRTGLDCWGVVMAALTLWDISAPDYDPCRYDAASVDAVYRALALRCGDGGLWGPVAGAPEPPDLVVMRLDAENPETAQHFGVYVGGGRVLHTLERRGSSTFMLSDRFFSRRIEGIWRWMGR